MGAVLGAHRVFMDVEDISPGENFAQKIEATLANCSHVIAVIGPRWREILDARAKQQNTDYVLHELATALKLKKTVVPVFVAGVNPASLTALPPQLADLPFHQAVELRDSSFNDDCARLAKTLRIEHTWFKKPIVWLAAAVVLALLTVLAANVGIGPWRDSHARKLQAAQLLKTAATQTSQAQYQSAFLSYRQILNLTPNDSRALEGQLDAAFLWLQNFHVLTEEGHTAEETAAPLLAEMSTVLDAGLARTNGKTTRAADIIAHQGWLHWLNEKIALPEVGNAERFFSQAVAIDPANLYAHAFWGNWLLQTRGDSAAALKHFQIALASHTHRDLVRRLQLGGLYENDTPGLRAEFVRALNDVRVNHEALDTDLVGRLSYLYSPTVSDAQELHEVLAAVPPDDAWQTFLWLNPEKPDGGTDTAWRDFIHANVAEISGNRTAALIEFKKVAKLLKSTGGGGRIQDYTTDAIQRLSH